MSYFPDLGSYGRNKLKVELDLSNHGTKSEIKNITGVDTSDFAKDTNIASLKLDVDELNID